MAKIGTTWVGERSLAGRTRVCTVVETMATTVNSVMASKGRLRRNSSRPPNTNPLGAACASSPGWPCASTSASTSAATPTRPATSASTTWRRSHVRAPGRKRLPRSRAMGPR